MRKTHHLTFRERERLVILFAQNKSIREASKYIGRDHSCIVRELQKTKSTRLTYSLITAEVYAQKQKRKARRKRKIENNEVLREYIHQKLKLRWSPEQIAHTLKNVYAQDTAMHISHESIYTYIYVLPRGELRKELISYLRQGAEGRRRRKRGTDERGKIPNMTSIHERPREVASRTVPGHWESDLIVGKEHKTAIGTLVERTTRTTILVPLKTKDAETVRKAFAKVVRKLPKEMKKSLTHDRGTEMHQHELFTQQTKVQVYFADPHSPWQRGTNENTNGLIRQFFPKGTDFSLVSKKELRQVQDMLNERPRKVLGWKTPKEVFADLLINGAVGD
jgi:transposase, IS30 family